MRATFFETQCMGESERISVVLPKKTKRDLDKLCEVERRSVSNYVYLLIQDAVDKAKEDGRIKED